MRKLTSIIAVARMFSSWYLKTKLWWINAMVIPISIFVMFKLVAPGLEVHALVGGIIASAWNSACNSLPQQMFFYKKYGLKDMFVASSISPFTFTFGVAISVFGSSLAHSLVLATLLIIYVPKLSFLYLLPMLILTWYIGSMLGFFISGYATNPVRIGALTNTLSFIFTMMPPVYYPLEAVPMVLRDAAIFIPTAALSHFSKILIGISPTVYEFHSMTAIFIYSLIFTILAVRYYKWREK